MSESLSTETVAPREIVWTRDKVARLWGYYATNRAYDAQYFSNANGGVIADFVQRHLSLAGRRVLDFGCGHGFLLEHLLAKGVACSGLEFSSETAALVRQRLGSNALFRGMVTADTLPVPLADSSQDVVFLVEVVEHLLSDQLIPTIAEVVRLLKPGGNVVVTVPNDENLDASKTMCPECGCVFHRWQHQRAFTAASLARLMGSLGLRTIVCQPTAWRTPTLRRWVAQLVIGPAAPPHLVYIGRRP